MKDFELWDKKLHENISTVSNIASNFFKKENKTNQVIVIQGDYLSGKTKFVEHAIERVIYLEKQHFNKTDGIVKIHYDKYKKIETYRLNNKKLKESGITKIIPNLSVSIGGISLDSDLKKILSDQINSKRRSIIWIENVQVDQPIFLEEVLDIINMNRETNTLFLITTRDSYVREEITCSIKNVQDLTMPLITSATDLKIKNKKSLLAKLDSMESSKREGIIEMSGGSYGRLETILELPIDNSYSTEQFEMIKKIFLEDNELEKSDKRIEILMLSFFIFPEELSTKWLDSLFPDPLFNYYEYLNKWENKKIIIQQKGKYKLNSIFLYSKGDYITKFNNIRAKKDISQKFDELLKEQAPEKYDLRYTNAKLFDDRKYEEYHFVFLLRNKMTGKVDSQYFNLLKILLQDANSEAMIDKERDKVLATLKKEKNQYLPLLIYSEYAYFRLQILLNYSYEKRKEVRPKIELQLHRLIQTFDDLVEKNETEMAIKIGILLAPEIINYLTKEDILEANRIYRYVTERIYKLKKHNYLYYKYYDVINKFISTSILDYKKASFNLQSIVEDMNESNNKIMNYEELLPMVFSNWLGLTLYLDDNSVKAALSFYKKKRKVIDKFDRKEYKIKNNLLLAELLQQDKIYNIDNNDIKNYKYLEEFHVSAINYAGLLVYIGFFDDAKKILKNIILKEESDDFYVFFCDYNLCIIELLSKEKNENEILNKLNYLVIPSLFSDSNVISIFEKRIQLLKELTVSEKSLTIIELDKKFRNNLHEKGPLYKYAWSFSDYQYWN